MKNNDTLFARALKRDSPSSQRRQRETSGSLASNRSQCITARYHHDLRREAFVALPAPL